MLQNFYCTVMTLSASALLSIGALQWPFATPKPTSLLPAAQQRETPAVTQDPARSQDKVVIETKLVNVTISVTDKLGRFVTGLSKEDFDVYDDKVKQDIAFFSNEDDPISMGFVYDVSGSMNHFTGRSLAMLRQFFENSHQQDEFFVIAFNNRSELVQDFTSLPEALLNRVYYIKSKGNTALFDATYMAVEKVRQGRHHRKVILIFSDGGENSSRYTGRELRNLLKENDVQIYSIGINAVEGAGTLKFISELTGGEAYFPFDQFSAELIYTRLALILRRQYVIGFYPSNITRGTKWHNVQLTLKAPKELGKLKLSYKNGYWITR